MTLRQVARLAVVGAQKAYRAIFIAPDLEPVGPGDDVADFLSGRSRTIEGIFDLHFVALAVDDRVRLGRLPAETEDEIAEAHHDRAELHGTLRAQIMVGDEPADQRRQVHERGEPAIEAGGGRVREEEVLGEIERQERAHAVIAEAFPHLRGEQPGKLPRMSEPCFASGWIYAARRLRKRLLNGWCINHPVSPQARLR